MLFLWEHRLAWEGAKVTITGDSIVVLCLLWREWKASNRRLINVVTEVEKLVYSCSWKVWYVLCKQN